uniref:NADH-ubiquinone oxidoreductase chain 5 n=1 Tax=Ocnus glacialis TaxID=3074281 RepID=A0AA51UD62_9ECHN|nr:NADH dehydrogenase subunit 5 [Ocnus glacialis]WMW14029.1 NADH dehydrogenase subunit 5 [Ocnus glacialis]
MNLNTFYLVPSLSLLIFMILSIVSLLNINQNSFNNNYIYQTALKALSFVGTINLFIFTINDNTYYTNALNFNLNSHINFNISIILDFNFIYFSTTALIVSWSIIEFSNYYLNNDPYAVNFPRLLIIFILNMLILTVSNNLLLLFIGWEGVGILSFILISWWFTRNEANNAALQAIIYNRIGDIGIIILISTTLIVTNGWNLNNIIFINNINPNYLNLILISALIGAMGKSAQFGLHPWLPAAMEGPTPVSALLHSSTMVVAGIFLLIRISNIGNNNLFLISCSLIGALTAIFAASSAFWQHDIKKIIAYSTTSQLGLMLLAIGLNQPNLALFHICTHAFFKALLFLCSGSIIHNNNNEQDLRKLPNPINNIPITSACLIIGSISLTGIPFLSGFFSKDLILEAIIFNPNNIIIFLLASIATLLTAGYSVRLINICFNNNNFVSSISPSSEENTQLYFPLIRLAIGTILTGWLLFNWIFETPNLFPNSYIKNIPLIMTITGGIVATLILLNINSNWLNNFFTQTWFYSYFINPNISYIVSNIALFLSTQTLDRGWNETIGGQGIFSLNKNITTNNQLIQSGYIKNYFLSISILLVIISIITFLSFL